MKEEMRARINCSGRPLLACVYALEFLRGVQGKRTLVEGIPPKHGSVMPTGQSGM